MPVYRFDTSQLRRFRMGPVTTALVTVTGGLLLAGLVALFIAFGVVILAVVGVAGLLATAWHRIRRRIRHSPSVQDRAHVAEVKEKHGYAIVEEAEVIAVEESTEPSK